MTSSKFPPAGARSVHMSVVDSKSKWQTRFSHRWMERNQSTIIPRRQREGQKGPKRRPPQLFSGPAQAAGSRCRNKTLQQNSWVKIKKKTPQGCLWIQRWYLPEPQALGTTASPATQRILRVRFLNKGQKFSFWGVSGCPAWRESERERQDSPFSLEASSAVHISVAGPTQGWWKEWAGRNCYMISASQFPKGPREK